MININKFIIKYLIYLINNTFFFIFKKKYILILFIYIYLLILKFVNILYV